ncbi:lytic transglycosylase domain-containing protein [Pengzhenrongella phosphoraccumulans]|uniref:aggregation-promoting factor C-terminal-like domain-containing protein n=1 Tax=Pengzhenrongella phosphoraccumulans TaxID=3114394 RepID=UPI00389112EE
MTISRSFDHPAITVGKAVVTAGLGMALMLVGTTGVFADTPASTTTAAAQSVPTVPRVARASRSAVRASLPVSVPVDVPFELQGRAEAQSMADAVAAQIEAQRVATEQAAAAAAAQVAAEQAAAQVAAAQAAQVKAAAATVKTSAKSSPTPVARPAPAPASVRDFASSLVGGGEQFACLDQLFQKESGWDAAATNRSSGAFGIPQALPGSKMASAGADWATNPNTQVIWGVGYVSGRYGSACAAWAAWQAKGWY